MSSTNGGSNPSKNYVFFYVGFIMLLPLLILMGIRIYLGINFDINCEGYLKRAADANTVEIAKTELDRSIKYLEDHNMIEGYTSVLWKEPSEDVGFFYNNLKSARNELDKVTNLTSQLERTNILIKLRETLLDHKKEGDSVTHPNGISRFPNNGFFFIGGWLLAIPCVFGLFLIMVGIKKITDL